MIDNIRQKSVRKKTASRIAAIQILYINHFNSQTLKESMRIFKNNYKYFLLDKLNIHDLDTLLLNDLLSEFQNKTHLFDEIIERYLSKNWKIDRLSINELNILRLSIYELIFLKKFDNKTIINEYVSLFSNFCGNPDFASGLLNQVLKNNEVSKNE